MLTCEQTTRLISEGLDRRLTLRERLAVRMHLVFCRACSRFRKQMEAIHAALLRLQERHEERLSDEARTRIKTALRDATDSG